jgi:phosphoribosylanthranilate isomerase
MPDHRRIHLPLQATDPTAPSRHALARVKICGVTQREQALAIAELGADFLGINFWPGSKRYLPLEKAVGWMKDVPSSTRLVGVFVNPDPRYVDEVLSTGMLSHVQLHGDESPEYCAAIAERGAEVLKAIRVLDEKSLESIDAYELQHVLLDAYHPIERGGSGETFPWQLAVAFKHRFPDRLLWLAGGLVSENVNAAIRGVGPFVVDVASGVESGTPGVKDLEKVAKFIREARSS